jgi:hypothetical protein
MHGKTPITRTAARGRSGSNKKTSGRIYRVDGMLAGSQAPGIYLNGVRSFVSGQSVAIRPLTLLVGENSAGKSTFLAMADAGLDRGLTHGDNRGYRG